MNGIERITARIEADGRAEIDRILSEAKAEAERIGARYRAEAEQMRADFAGQNEQAAAERKERLVRAAQMEGRKLQLAARQAMVARAYDRALEKLCALSEKESVALLTALLRQASIDGGGEVLFSAEDEKAGKRAVKAVNETGGDLRIAREERPIGRGFLLREGRTEVNCTFETLVRSQKEQTAGMVAKILFAEQEARRGKTK